MSAIEERADGTDGGPEGEPFGRPDEGWGVVLVLSALIVVVMLVVSLFGG